MYTPVSLGTQHTEGRMFADKLHPQASGQQVNGQAERTNQKILATSQVQTYYL